MPENTIIIPSSSQITYNIGATVFGATLTGSNSSVVNITENKNFYVGSDNFVHGVPGNGVLVQRFPAASNILNKASGAATVITTGLDVANTWTENNNNTNGDRVIKTGIQVIEQH